MHIQKATNVVYMMLKPSSDKTIDICDIFLKLYEKPLSYSVNCGRFLIIIAIAITSGGLHQDLASLPQDCVRRNFSEL